MIRLSSDETTLNCQGSWILSNLSDLHRQLTAISQKLSSVTEVNLRGVSRIDTAGALFLSDLLEKMRGEGREVQVSGLRKKFQPLFSLVSDESEQLHLQKSHSKKSSNFFSFIGEWSVEKYLNFLAFFAFFGELMIIIFQNILNPSRIQWRSIFKIVDEAGYRALSIIGLMSFLIGVVVAYQLTTELAAYGATVFVVDVSGIAILREFAPLITAVIMAGRTSTSFAALLGIMKVNEEIDALRTMGVVPLERLVLPRIFALIIVMPLLTIFSNVFGVFGSMVMAKWTIGLSFLGYLERFREVVELKQLMLGLIKTPVFAIIVSAVGCFQGLQTGTSADSVGWQTTKAAVQAIFLIIVADAGFSILYSMMGL